MYPALQKVCRSFKGDLEVSGKKTRAWWGVGPGLITGVALECRHKWNRCSASIGELANIYSQQKLTGRLAGFSTEMIRTAFGGTPFLTGQLPLDLNKDYTQQLQDDHDVAMKILKTCIAIYKDPTKSSQDLQAGPCSQLAY